MQRQAAALRREDAALRLESLTHGDLVLVDVVDTYRSVPSKLLQFYKWYARTRTRTRTPLQNPPDLLPPPPAGLWRTPTSSCC